MQGDGKKYQLSIQKINDSSYTYEGLAFYTPSSNENYSIPIYLLKHSSFYGDRYLF